MDILLQLQYSRTEATEMIDGVLKNNSKVNQSEDLISLIFKSSQSAKGGD